MHFPNQYNASVALINREYKDHSDNPVLLALLDVHTGQEVEGFPQSRDQLANTSGMFLSPHSTCCRY